MAEASQQGQGNPMGFVLPLLHLIRGRRYEVEARTGVYICHCGTNIAGTVDVAAVADYAGSLPEVAVARHHEHMCSDPGQQMLKQDIREAKKQE